MEEKDAQVDHTLAKGDIPLPATHRSSSVTSPRKIWGRRVALILAFLCTLRLLTNVAHIRHSNIDGHQEQKHDHDGMVNALTHPPQKGHLRGKEAEKLFL